MPITKLGKFLTLPVRFSAFITSIDLSIAATEDAVIVLSPLNNGDDLIGIGNGTAVPDGRIVFICNGSRTKSIDVIGESGSATAAGDRLYDSSTIDPDEGHGFVYDGAGSRWTRFL